MKPFLYSSWAFNVLFDLVVMILRVYLYAVPHLLNLGCTMLNQCYYTLYFQNNDVVEQAVECPPSLDAKSPVCRQGSSASSDTYASCLTHLPLSPSSLDLLHSSQEVCTGICATAANTNIQVNPVDVFPNVPGAGCVLQHEQDLPDGFRYPCLRGQIVQMLDSDHGISTTWLPSKSPVGSFIVDSSIQSDSLSVDDQRSFLSCETIPDDSSYTLDSGTSPSRDSDSAHSSEHGKPQ